ncbi:hypothetical protein ACX0G9_05015 [Flavitalea flava]
MKIAFTLCSNNYYSQALVLGRSFLLHNPGFSFYIGLVDKKRDTIDYGYPGITVLEAGEIESGIYSLARKYTIVELNTAVKPQFFLHFFSTLKADEVYYLDPDICVYRDFAELSSILTTNDIILTPHILTPIPVDDKTPMESDFLNYGIYNLGFLGLKHTPNTIDMLKWWKERTYLFGYHDLSKGLFVDQLWMNLVPVLFQKTYISHHPGLNMGPWNFHERSLSRDEGSFRVNKQFPLVFFHFSTFKPFEKIVFHPVFNRFTAADREDLAEIYREYREKLQQSGFSALSKIPCHYVEWRQEQLAKQKLVTDAGLSSRTLMIRKIKKRIPSGIRKLILQLVQT